jgi:glycosyltransferase involved in cell wall biosynthesis
MEKHTFAICAYKESPYLEECICSLLGQTIRSNIIIVTSTPNDYIKDLAAKYQIPCYINGGEGGITQDWNFGYAQCHSRYITIAHQDDVYEKEYLEHALRALDHAKRPLIYFSDYYEIRNGEKVTDNRLLKIKRLMLLPLRPGCFQNSRFIRRRILSFGSPICCPAVTFAAENLPQVVFRNHFRACEDWETWEMISRLKGSFLYDTGRWMGHRIHEGSETSAIIGDNKRSLEEYEMFCKFWPKWIAGMLSRVYSGGQASNQLSGDK